MSKMFDIWFVFNFLIQSLFINHFKAKTLCFSSDMFQIKILWFGGKFKALIVGLVLENLKCYFCMSGKVSLIPQQLPETLMLPMEKIL